MFFVMASVVLRLGARSVPFLVLPSPFLFCDGANRAPVVAVVAVAPARASAVEVEVVGVTCTIRRRRPIVPVVTRIEEIEIIVDAATSRRKFKGFS